MTKSIKNLTVSSMVEDIVGCKWSLRVLQLIKGKVQRPGQMQKRTPGLSTKVLNERLTKLQRFGIIEKKIFPVSPPRVEYSFTTFGKKFLSIINHIEKLQKQVSDPR